MVNFENFIYPRNIRQYVKKADFVIIGSGAAGATLARELSKRGKKVIIVERGERLENFGKPLTLLRSLGEGDLTYLFKAAIRRKMVAGTINLGGSTVFSGNGAARGVEKISKFGINLEKEYVEAEKELNVKTSDEESIVGGAKKLLEAGREMGYKFEPVTSFQNREKCNKCSRCLFGCPSKARWTAIDWVDQAVNDGATLITDTKATKVLISNGKAIGVKGISPNGQLAEILGDRIIVSAGALNTPVILQNSGINAGNTLFVNFGRIVVALIEDEEKNPWWSPIADEEFLKSKGFNMVGGRINLNTLNNWIRDFPLIGIISNFVPRGILKRKSLVGGWAIATDEPIGKVHKDGRIEKRSTQKDKEKLEEGIRKYKEVLVNAGAKKERIFSPPLLIGYYPGGTSPIGEVVDKNLETKIENLYVCDASVFPNSVDIRPFAILPIVALAKFLSKKLA